MCVTVTAMAERKRSVPLLRRHAGAQPNTVPAKLETNQAIGSSRRAQIVLPGGLASIGCPDRAGPK